MVHFLFWKPVFWWGRFFLPTGQPRRKARCYWINLKSLGDSSHTSFTLFDQVAVNLVIWTSFMKLLLTAYLFCLFYRVCLFDSHFIRNSHFNHVPKYRWRISKDPVHMKALACEHMLLCVYNDLTCEIFMDHLEICSHKSYKIHCAYICICGLWLI